MAPPLVLSRCARRKGAWLEHFYLKPEFQGRGLGSSVLGAQLAALGAAATVRLNVLQGSRARRLYDHFGFLVE
jgi:GNAT superfamily N-acetyltransferase